VRFSPVAICLVANFLLLCLWGSARAAHGNGTDTPARTARKGRTSPSGIQSAMMSDSTVVNSRTQVLPAKLDEAPKDFIYVEGGTLSHTGSSNTCVSSFYICKYEVTYGEWLAVFEQKEDYGYTFDGSGDGGSTNHPVVSVNWYDCIKWCNLRSDIDGRAPVYYAQDTVYRRGRSNDIIMDAGASGYRLPADAEWEYAARGGRASKGFVYSGSDELDKVGWYKGNSKGAEVDWDEGRGTWPVGMKAANELGLHDMSGNVWEWCYDWHPDSVGWARVRRGGTWGYFSDYCRTSFRYANGPKFGGLGIGFRLVVSGDRRAMGGGPQQSTIALPLTQTNNPTD